MFDTLVKLRLTRLWGGCERELIWSEFVGSGKAWPYECRAVGTTDRNAGDAGLLRELRCIAAIGTGVGGVAGRIPLASRLLEVHACHRRSPQRTVDRGTWRSSRRGSRS